jgi:hypothetical protein
MGSFKTMEAFIDALVEMLDRLLHERLVAIYIRREENQAEDTATITMVVATPDLESFFSHQFVCKFTEPTYGALRSLVKLQVELIDQQLTKAAELVDVDSDEGLLIVCGIYENQLLTYIPKGESNHFKAIKMKLSAWAILKPAGDPVGEKARELLPLLQNVK